MTDTQTNPTEIVVIGKRRVPAPVAYQLNAPACFIDIYPFEGGRYSLPNAVNLDVSVSKSIRSPYGTFSITLPPGGPQGPNGPLSWSQVITPMSTVVIGMRRGDVSRIVMIGVITTPVERQIWNTGSPVSRPITIQGRDMGHYFSMQTYLSLWFLGLVGAPLPANPSLVTGAIANDPALGPGIVSGRPDEIATSWFKEIMGGTSGALSQTAVQYRGSKVTFPNFMGYVFEEFDADTPNLYGELLLTTDETWYDKFEKILPFPWLEFFVITAPPNTYPAATGGTAFSTVGMGAGVTATPTAVGRVNPLPVLTAAAEGTAASFTGIDTSAWNKLTVYSQSGQGFLSSSVGFDESLVLNYFSLVPTAFLGLYGQSNANIVPFLVAYISAADQASIERYGYRPANGEFRWLADPSGVGAIQGNANSAQFITNLMARFCSQYGPEGLMARATVQIFLRPDIQPGQRFRYAPFKSGEPWDFYIESVTHNFQFGGTSSTSLQLTRGLPASIYADDSNTGLLYNIHIGNAQRVDGVYTSGLPAGSHPPLKFFGPGGQLDFFAGLSKVYSTPQATQATP